MSAAGDDRFCRSEGSSGDVCLGPPGLIFCGRTPLAGRRRVALQHLGNRNSRSQPQRIRVAKPGDSCRACYPGGQKAQRLFDPASPLPPGTLRRAEKMAAGSGGRKQGRRTPRTPVIPHQKALLSKRFRCNSGTVSLRPNGRARFRMQPVTPKRPLLEGPSPRALQM